MSRAELTKGILVLLLAVAVAAALIWRILA